MCSDPEGCLPAGTSRRERPPSQRSRSALPSQEQHPSLTDSEFTQANTWPHGTAASPPAGQAGSHGRRQRRHGKNGKPVPNRSLFPTRLRGRLRHQLCVLVLADGGLARDRQVPSRRGAHELGGSGSSLTHSGLALRTAHCGQLQPCAVPGVWAGKVRGEVNRGGGGSSFLAGTRRTPAPRCWPPERRLARI